MRLIAIMVGMGLLMTSLMLLPAPAAAIDTTYFLTGAPTSYNSTYWTQYPRYTGSEATNVGPMEFLDPFSLWVYTTTDGKFEWAKTNDFTDTANWSAASYYEEVGPVYWQAVSHMPVEGATIEGVQVVMSFYGYRPNVVLYMSSDDEVSYNYTSRAGSMSWSEVGYVTWDVTSLADWTPALLNSTDVWVKVKMDLDLGVNYYLDYLGLEIFWSGEFEGGGGGEDSAPTGGGSAPPDMDYSIIYDAEGIIGIMGFVGLIGMVATPAIMVYANRQNQGDGKMNLFIKGLVMFMFFLTFFMVSLGI